MGCTSNELCPLRRAEKRCFHSSLLPSTIISTGSNVTRGRGSAVTTASCVIHASTAKEQITYHFHPPISRCKQTVECQTPSPQSCRTWLAGCLADTYPNHHFCERPREIFINESKVQIHVHHHVHRINIMQRNVTYCNNITKERLPI